MSEGRDEHDRPSRYEAFWQDDVFADFLEFMAQRAERTGEACTLLLLGDFLDFLHTPPPAGGDEASRREPLAALDRIARGHRTVFPR